MPDRALDLTSNNLTDLFDYFYPDAVLRRLLPKHPRIAPIPFPAARWGGVPQRLRSGASPDHFVHYDPEKGCGVATVDAFNNMGYRMGRLTRRMILPHGHGREVDGRAVLPRDENVRLLDTIDTQLHQGHPIAIAVDYHPGSANISDGLSDHWLYITDRDFLPDKTVYYLAQDNAFGRNLRYYVHAHDLSLVNPPDSEDSDSYTVVNATTVMERL